jgi:hypothetical protein
VADGLGSGLGGREQARRSKPQFGPGYAARVKARMQVDPSYRREAVQWETRRNEIELQLLAMEQQSSAKARGVRGPPNAAHMSRPMCTFQSSVTCHTVQILPLICVAVSTVGGSAS